MSVFPLGGQNKSVLPWGAVANAGPAGFWEKMVVPYGLVAYQDFDIRYIVNGSYYEGQFYDKASTASMGLFIVNQGGLASVPSFSGGPYSTCTSYDGASTGYSVFNNGVGSTPNGLPVGSTSRSFAFWLQVPNFSNYFSPIIYGTSANTQYFQIYIDKSGGTFGAGKIVFSDAGTGNMVTTATVTAGVPQHIVVATTSTTLSSAVFYLNGVSVSGALSGSDNTLNTVASSNYHYLNAINSTPTNGGAGQLMELRAYNRAINDADVAELYAAGLAGRNTWYTQYSEMPVISTISSSLARQFGSIIPS